MRILINEDPLKKKKKSRTDITMLLSTARFLDFSLLHAQEKLIMFRIIFTFILYKKNKYNIEKNHKKQTTHEG